MDSATDNNDKTLSDEEVTRYLRNHPGFFLKHEELLSEIKLTHKSGKAVSLLERQVEVLRERNMEMRGRLNNLLENAQRNDVLFEKTKALILSLLEAKRADELSETFCQGLLHNFEVDAASLIVFSGVANSRLRVGSYEDASRHIGGVLKSNKALCGVLRDSENEYLFGAKGSGIGSAAVVPLHNQKPLGVIAIGSKDPQHFQSSMGTLFLGYIAEVINRVLPRLLKG